MLKLEEQSIVDYEKLLAETKKRVQNEIISEHLKKLISDEKKHVLLVKELLQILERQPD
jgi:rubrerythrin